MCSQTARHAQAYNFAPTGMAMVTRRYTTNHGKAAAKAPGSDLRSIFRTVRPGMRRGRIPPRCRRHQRRLPLIIHTQCGGQRSSTWTKPLSSNQHRRSIGKAYAWAFPDSNECVDFVNRSTKTIVHVRFLFTHAGSDSDPRGTLSPWTCVDRLSRAQRKRITAAGSMATLCCRRQGQPSTISVRVDEVDFADGTSWQAFQRS